MVLSLSSGVRLVMVLSVVRSETGHGSVSVVMSETGHGSLCRQE